MNYLLTRLPALFVFPLGLAILLCLLSLPLMRAGRKRLGPFIVLLSMTILWVSSTQIAADWVIGSLESRYPPLKVEETPAAAAIVILGGVTRGVVPGTEMTDLGDGVDRLIHGARLWKAGKAPLIVLSGGNAEWFQPESEAMMEVLKILEIPADVMLLESKSRNTHQNVLYSVPLLNGLGINRILLVTSAYHMRRAEAIFQSMGITVLPAATDYQVVQRFTSIIDWLPQSEALLATTRGVKEYIGWWVFKIQSIWGQ